MEQISENRPEKESNQYLIGLRKALDTKNMALLREVVDRIQELVQLDNKVYCSKLSDSDLEALLDNGKGMITVGTGSLGHIIYIRKRGELCMPGLVKVQGKDALSESTLFFRKNFATLFDLPDSFKPEDDLIVKF